MTNIRYGRVEHFCTGMWNCILNMCWRLLYKLRCRMYPAQNSMFYLDTAMRVVLIFYREMRVQRNRCSVVTVLSNCRNEQVRKADMIFVHFFTPPDFQAKNQLEIYLIVLLFKIMFGVLWATFCFHALPFWPGGSEKEINSNFQKLYRAGDHQKRFTKKGVTSGMVHMIFLLFLLKVSLSW